MITAVVLGSNVFGDLKILVLPISTESADKANTLIAIVDAQISEAILILPVVCITKITLLFQSGDIPGYPVLDVLLYLETYYIMYYTTSCYRFEAFQIIFLTDL